MSAQKACFVFSNTEIEGLFVVIPFRWRGMAMGLALVGQMLALPSAVPPALPTPLHLTPTSSGDIARSLDLAILSFPGHL